MEKALRIAALASLAIFFCSNLVWAGGLLMEEALKIEISQSIGPLSMFMFGAILLGLSGISRAKFLR